MGAPGNLATLDRLEAHGDLLEASDVTGGYVVGNDVLVLLKAAEGRCVLVKR